MIFFPGIRLIAALCLVFLTFTPALLFSQQYFLPLNRTHNLLIEPSLNALDAEFHTSSKPYRAEEVKKYVNEDSIIGTFAFHPNRKKYWPEKKLRTDDLVKLDTGQFHVIINPLLNLEVTKTTGSDTLAYINTRGLYLAGSIGEKFSFYSSFYENQGKFVNYIEKDMRRKGVAHGQGLIKEFKNDTSFFERIIFQMSKKKANFSNYLFDYNMASGYVSYTPSQYFNIQFGHDKNFIGDGYRSLILSDNSFNYPFLKIATTVWKLKYINLFAEFQDKSVFHTYEMGFQKKYGTFHYLSYNINKRINIGLFEAIIWQNQDSSGQRGFDINYLNPIIFYRPVELSVGSPDNALMGLTAKVKISNSVQAYGQVMLDEFKLDEVKSGNGWYANKQAVQLGARFFNIFTISNLHYQTEFNYVRPFMYSHVNPLQNYAHYNQSLAHPLNANFYEVLSFLNYRYKSVSAEIKLMYAEHGADTANLNFGNNIYKPYVNPAHLYGNRVGQGLKNILNYREFRIAYLINPKYNLNAEIGIVNRSKVNSKSTENDTFITFGIRTSLINRYYDF